MNALIQALPAYFNLSHSTPLNEDIKKRAVDPSSNANGGFGNNPTQKTSFPAGTAKSTPASTKSTPVSSSSVPTNTPSSSVSSSSSTTPTSSSSAMSSPLESMSATVTSSSTGTSPIISPSSASDTSGGGLSGGAIGAIVAVIVIIIGGVAAFFIMRRRRQKRIAARAGAGAMRDPYNEGFSSFPPPPAPMAFTSSDNYNNNASLATTITTTNNNNNNTNSGAAGSAHYQPQVQQQHLPPLASPTATYNYHTNNLASYPITAPNMISTPPMSSSNIPATMANVPPASHTTNLDPLSVDLATAATTTAASTAINNDAQQQQPTTTQPGDIWQQPPIGTFTVLTTYTPTLSDEIDVQPNDQVQIFEEYDDGWCLGVNITRGQTRGVFPKHCVTPDSTTQQPLQLANPSSQSLTISDPSTTINTAGKRVSSLYMENPNPILPS